MSVMRRFRLLPGLCRFSLPGTSVQLGSDPELALQLELPDKRFIELLDRLDTWLDEAAYAVTAKRLGVRMEHATAMLEQLRGAGLLLDTDALSPDGTGADRRSPLTPETQALVLRRGKAPGPVLARRRRQRVFVNGTGRLAQRAAEILRESELGRVWCANESRRSKATLTVLINSSQPSVLTARAHARRERPYLSVNIMDGLVNVGPLVQPGRGPCVRCVELHHLDAVPQWRTAVGFDNDEGEPIEATVRGLSAAIIASSVLQHIDGEHCEAEAATVQVRPSLTMIRRTWTPHPKCGCMPIRPHEDAVVSQGRS